MYEGGGGGSGVVNIEKWEGVGAGLGLTHIG